MVFVTIHSKFSPAIKIKTKVTLCAPWAPLSEGGAPANPCLPLLYSCFTDNMSYITDNWTWIRVRIKTITLLACVPLTIAKRHCFDSTEPSNLSQAARPNWRRLPLLLQGQMKSRHMSHHYKDHSVSFGISSPLWDHIFGTYPSSLSVDKKKS